jgi:predicted DsbA family dithiol-disulfide isomerase
MRARLFVALFALVALVFVASCGRPLSPVDREIAETPAGVVTVVEFVDYDCPFCKDLHPHLWELLDTYQGAVRVVVKVVPLDKHEGARRLAAAEVCAREQKKALEMHDVLMRAVDRKDEALDEAARGVGISVTEWRDCMRSDRAETAISEDVAAWEEMGADGLPMVFIGEEKFVGLNDIEVYEKALREATGG